MTTISEALKEFHLDVKKYLITTGLIGFSYFGFVAVLLNLYMLRIGYGTSFIGLVNGSTAIAFAISSIPSGIIGNKWGIRRTAVVGMILLSTGISLLPLTQFLPRSIWDISIIVTRLMTGTGFAFFIVNSYPYLTDATNSNVRTHAFAVQSSLSPLLGFAGGLIAGFLPGLISKSMAVTTADPRPFAFILIACGIILVPGIFLIRSTTDRKIEARKPTNKKTQSIVSYSPYIIIFFLAISGYMRVSSEGAARSFFNVYMEIGLGKSPGLIGFAMAAGQLMAFPAALFAPVLSHRIGKTSTIVLSTLLTGAAILLMAIFPHWIIATIGFSLTLGLRAITQTVAGVVQMEIVKPEWRGVTSGIVSMAMGLGFSSMSLGGGYLIQSVEFSGLFFIAACISALGALVFLAFFGKPRGEYAVSDKNSSIRRSPIAKVP